MDTNNKTNWLALLVAAVAGVIVGFIFYGVLFSNQWMAGNGITVEGSGETMKMLKNGVEIPNNPAIMGINFLAMLFYAFIMNWLLKKANATTLFDGAIVGLVIGSIMCVGIFINNMFAFSPISLSMVDGLYAIVLFKVMGAIIGAWQKR